MKKFNYQLTIEAPGKEIADMIIKLICAENQGLITEAKSEVQPKQEEKKQEIPFPENKVKENFMKGISEFEKIMHIIKCCVQDENLISEIAEMLGFDHKPEKTKQP